MQSFSHNTQKGRVLVSKVSSIHGSTVKTEDNQQYPYDYLIICSGSRYADPDFLEDRVTEVLSPNDIVVSARKEHLEDYHNEIELANTILIVGGGIVGVELAAEIVDTWVNKNVIIVHSHSRLMSRSPPKAIDYAEHWLTSHGVRLILNDKVIGRQGNTFKTLKGQTIPAQLVFLCTGNVPNTDFFVGSFKEKLTNTGLVKVNSFLQVEGFLNIFAAGDITFIPQQDEKLCQTAYQEMKTVIANVIQLEKGNNLKEYRATPCPVITSLGKYDAIFTYRGFAVTGFFPALLKEAVEWKECVFYWNFDRFIQFNPARFLYKGVILIGGILGKKAGKNIEIV